MLMNSRTWVFPAFACTVLLTLAGCAGGGAAASKSGDVSSSGNDLVTESDEPEGRKRARLRVELATGYFEQGQTSVALDEIKQSLNADANYAPAYSLRGLAYMRMNENRLAEESFRRAISLNPRDAGVAHNLAWLLCQQARYSEASPIFQSALVNPVYVGRAKTLMAFGICLAREGKLLEAEDALSRSYELDAGNPVTGYNLSQLLFQRGDFNKAQFYTRRLNNGEYSNAETLWLGIKVEQKLGNRDAVSQLGDQLRRRYAQSREFAAYERGAFNE